MKAILCSNKLRINRILFVRMKLIKAYVTYLTAKGAYIDPFRFKYGNEETQMIKDTE